MLGKSIKQKTFRFYENKKRLSNFYLKGSNVKSLSIDKLFTLKKTLSILYSFYRNFEKKKRNYLLGILATFIFTDNLLN